VEKVIKTAHLTNYYHKNSGGISTSYNNLLAAAGRHRRHVRLIVPGETEAVEDVNDFARIYYVPARQSPVFDKRYRLMTPLDYFPAGSIIRRILSAEMPDVVEVTDKYTLSMFGAMVRIGKFAQLGRPPLVHFSCERMDDNIASFLSKGGAGRWLARRVMGNYTFPTFDYHIANSAYTAEEFLQSVMKAYNPRRSDRFFNLAWRYFNAPRVAAAERIFVCPRGVDNRHFTPERRSAEGRRRLKQATGAPDGAAILLYAGRISPEKNIDLLVRMMEELRNAPFELRLAVAGDGPLAGWLREQSREKADGRIVLLGHLDKATLAEHYANADIFVHPNPREPFGIAPLEAMASGVPTLAPSAGGILSYASQDNAWLAEPLADAFAGAILAIMKDPEERKRRTANAVATAASNTREAATDRLFETYDRIYEDFQRRKELFTDRDAARRFDFSSIV
jgi:alpha-1,6-mannosyltransferase